MGGELLEPEEAARQILERCAPLPRERRRSALAAGAYLAQALPAPEPLPALDCSAMDGYAVRHGVLTEGEWLPVLGECPAGSPPVRLPEGSALRIFTGAPLPLGADAVLIQENAQRRPIAEREHGREEISLAAGARPPIAGAHIRRSGGDLPAGAEALPVGAHLGPGELALLAALGLEEVSVYRKPKIALILTGSELVAPFGAPPPPGKIRESNGLLLMSALAALGLSAELIGPLPDEDHVIEAALERCAEADVLITVGGVSVGAYDRSGVLLRERIGDGLCFSKVAIKPGKPFTFGAQRGKLFFGLPGNPVSAQVIFELFVAPALQRLSGATRCHRPLRWLPVRAPLPPGGRRLEWLRARLCEGAPGSSPQLDPRRSQSSGALSSAAGATHLIARPVHARPLEAGERVPALTLGAGAPGEWRSVSPFEQLRWSQHGGQGASC